MPGSINKVTFTPGRVVLDHRGEYTQSLRKAIQIDHHANLI